MNVETPTEVPVFEPHWVQRPSTAVIVVHRPSSVGAALELLAEGPASGDRPARRIIAGGTDLILELARSSGPPVELVDVSAIEGFSDISHDAAASVLRLGGGVTHNDILRDGRVAELALPLAQACLEIGSPQLRNRATVAGNLITASPANDSISALMALGASVELSRHQAGAVVSRTVELEDFFAGFRQTVVAVDELLSAVTVPIVPGRTGIWVKLGLRKAQAISVVHAGVVVDFAADGITVDSARIALGSVAATVVLAAEAGASLVGEQLDESTMIEAARLAAAGIEPIDDGRASADYRRSAVETVVHRALQALAVGRERVRWAARIPTLGEPDLGPPAQPVVSDETSVSIRVNGRDIRSTGAASVTMLEWLRDHAGTGTKEGCAEGECGACTVLFNGAAVMSCLVSAAQADGGSITTIEGLSNGDHLSEMQQSFVDRFAVQCGYCIPGFVMSATALCGELEHPTRAEVEFGLAGNLCRCTGYYAILDAIGSVGPQSAVGSKSSAGSLGGGQAER